jgi:hypothetical protein
VGTPDAPVALRCGGGRQPRRQGFAGDRLPRPQIVGLVDTPTGFCAANPQPVGQRVPQLAAQLGLAGLAGQLVDQRVSGCWQSTGFGFEAL